MPEYKYRYPIYLQSLLDKYNIWWQRVQGLCTEPHR